MVICSDVKQASRCFHCGDRLGLGFSIQSEPFVGAPIFFHTGCAVAWAVSLLTDLSSVEANQAKLLAKMIVETE